jgi:hypothetical protein
MGDKHQEAIMKLVKPTLALALSSALLLSSTAYAEEPISPIFGNASATLTSVDKNKSVVGKSYYADLYGYYGNVYNNYAGYYGLYAAYSSSDSTKSSYYGYASNYAYNAYVYYYYASYYAARGI